MTGIAFIYGGVIVGRIERAVVPAIFAFFVNLARELLKDVEDMEGDRIEHAVTLAGKIWHQTVTAAGDCLASYADFCHNYGSNIHIVSFCVLCILCFIADCLICASIILIWYDYSSTAIRRVSTILKISMIFGLLSIIAGSM